VPKSTSEYRVHGGGASGYVHKPVVGSTVPGPVWQASGGGHDVATSKAISLAEAAAAFRKEAVAREAVANEEVADRVMVDASRRVRAPLAVSREPRALSFVAVALAPDGGVLVHAPRTLKPPKATQKAHGRMNETSG
jgi:hypothetical protein